MLFRTNADDRVIPSIVSGYRHSRRSRNMANSSSRSEGHRSAGIRTSPVEDHSREDPSIGSRDGDAQRRERGDQKVFMVIAQPRGLPYWLMRQIDSTAWRHWR